MFGVTVVVENRIAFITQNVIEFMMDPIFQKKKLVYGVCEFQRTDVKLAINSNQKHTTCFRLSKL